MRKLKLPLLAILALSVTSCASIVSRSVYPVTFTSDPAGIPIKIENRDGFFVYTGHTPVTVPLRSAAGYMKKEHYKVTMEFPGREPAVTYISATLNGWYFGNILLGGIIGMLIVDPATGAMYRIPDQYYNESVRYEEPREYEFQELRIHEVNNLPEGISRDDLVLIGT